MKIDFLSPWPSGKPPAPELCGEEARASVLAAYGLDALEDDPELAQITHFAAKLCNAPIALVSLVEKERQRFLAKAGLEERETPRPTSFCAHAMLEPEPMVVPDAKEDPRFETNPLVTGHPYIRFYAGAPLISHEGAPLGSLCVIDTKPRPEGLTGLQIEGLQVLAASVMRRLRHRRENMEQAAQLENRAEQLTQLLDSIPDIAWAAEPGPVFRKFNARWSELTGQSAPMEVADWEAFIHPEDWQRSLDKFAECVASARPFEDEWRLKLADGNYRWVISRAVPSGDDPATARWFGTITDIDQGRRLSEQRDLLARELSHRIKNIFAVVAGLVSLKKRAHSEVSGFADDLTGSIRALGRANDFVRPAGEVAAKPLGELLTVLLEPYIGEASERITIDIESSEVGERAVTPLALVFHELATNAAKYGALSDEIGRITITGRLSDDRERMLLTWQESGGPPPPDASSDGFGTRMVKLAVEGQLGGKIERAMGKDGIRLVLDLSREAIAR